MNDPPRLAGKPLIVGHNDERGAIGIEPGK
jgi:hypothetical protein